jgi:uroporphyrin-III C-methyltransferase
MSATARYRPLSPRIRPLPAPAILPSPPSIKPALRFRGAQTMLLAMEKSLPSPGKLWLVGAGPGDPDLLTLRAARLLASADLVVHDGLVGDGVLALIPAHVERISVAKQRSRHTMKQELINELLVRETLAGRQVVRLKGGDPFIFGRGGEELEAAREAGVPCEVVPGITAAAGCAAQAGLPLTHREDASAVSFVAGQCKDLTDQDWSGLAGHGRTLVIYMGLATASAIADKLIADGVSPDLPVAVVERGTTKDARVLRTLLTDLGDLVVREKVASPALIIVGKVAARADALDCLGAPGVAQNIENIRDFT